MPGFEFGTLSVGRTDSSEHAVAAAAERNAVAVSVARRKMGFIVLEVTGSSGSCCFQPALPGGSGFCHKRLEAVSGEGARAEASGFRQEVKHSESGLTSRLMPEARTLAPSPLVPQAL